MRWGPVAGESPGQASGPSLDDQRGRREDGFGGQSSGRNRGGLRHEVQDVGNFGDPLEVGISEWVESPGRQTAGLDGERAPQAVRDTPIFPGPGRLAKAGRAGTRPADRYGEAPRWTLPAVCKGAAGGRCRRVRTVLGNAGMGREMSSPEKYYGLYWGIWRVAGRGGLCEDRGRRHR